VQREIDEQDVEASLHPQRVAGNSRLGQGTSGQIDGANVARAIVQRTGLLVQPKLVVGPVNDAYEQEADAAAEQVVRRSMAPGATSGVLQREQAEEEEELQASRVPASSLQAGTVDEGTEAEIRGARGGGAALPEGVRTGMEQSFGADFGNVRVHNGPSADRLNRSLQAKAFTTGSDVFFRSGEYNPASGPGQKLLAHELTHVVQQGGAQVSRKSDVGEESELDG
jgi:hypothetical protein